MNDPLPSENAHLRESRTRTTVIDVMVAKEGTGSQARDACVYGKPEIEDYGTLADLTAELDLLIPLGQVPVLSATVGPTSGGGGVGGVIDQGPESVPADPPGGDAPGEGTGGDGDVLDEGDFGEAPTGTGNGDTAGDTAAGSPSAGGGDGAGELPFTGYPAAAAAALGALMTGAGAALRSALRRR